jgi:hypothetical protein
VSEDGAICKRVIKIDPSTRFRLEWFEKPKINQVMKENLAVTNILDEATFYSINLAHRTDRWVQQQANFRKYGFPCNEVVRWPATFEPDFGALGCAKSHFALLQHFLECCDARACVVFEDDFLFTRSWVGIRDELQRFFSASSAWRVVLLTATEVELSGRAAGALVELRCGQSSAGYIVTRRYANVLAGTFLESIQAMVRLRHLGQRHRLNRALAVDQVWKINQRSGEWFIPKRVAGEQSRGFSDIEGADVDYRSVTYLGTSLPERHLVPDLAAGHEMKCGPRGAGPFISMSRAFRTAGMRRAAMRAAVTGLLITPWSLELFLNFMPSRRFFWRFAAGIFRKINQFGKGSSGPP